MWDLPGPGTEPGSPALAGRVLTTGPPGKPIGQCLSTGCSVAYCVPVIGQGPADLPFFP